MTSFDEFFRLATRRSDGTCFEPYGYQIRLARDGLPAVVEVPTGAGKTAIVLAWLWRLLHGPDPDGTPRRLVYALPQRSLVEQVSAQVGGWLKNLDLAGSDDPDRDDRVVLDVVMGGDGYHKRQWRLDMHRPTVLVGTVDSLVSKALNRGYGVARATYPIDFALVTNGAQWVIDEIQLCPESTTTLRQLAAFARRFGTAEPFALTCMSATVPEALLDTVDNAAPTAEDAVSIEPGDRTGELETRLTGRRTIRRLPVEPGDHAGLAAAIRERHRPGTLTLVVVNTVKAACEAYQRLRKQAGDSDLVLMHSRFRGHERQELVKRITAPPGDGGRIIIATQVVEAGIDLDAAVLVTEGAPWPSVVQRAGRCNRAGRLNNAELCWLPPAQAAPYPDDDVTAACTELQALDGMQVTGEDLLGRPVRTTEQAVAVLRSADLLALFDTAPDLSGADLDIAPFVRDAEDLDAQVAWAIWEPEPGTSDGRPPADAKAPLAEWRCRVPLRSVPDLVKRGPVWKFDQGLGRWITLRERARPGEVLVVAASTGGYDPRTGFDPAAGPVPECPQLVTAVRPESGTEDAFGADSVSVAQDSWISLRQHSEETRDQAEGLVRVLKPSVADKTRQSVVTAAYLHDIGKAHPTWQDALCRLARPEEEAEVRERRPWAKSAAKGRLWFAGNVAFRHELASLLLAEGPLQELLSAAPDTDLARYLILAHHGKLRVQVRDAGETTPGLLLGLKAGAALAMLPVLDTEVGSFSADLDQFSLGGARSWTRDALALLDRYGPFVLAYLETVVRIADWRASAGEEVPK